MIIKRILLRKFKESDYKDLHDYLSKEEVVEYEPYEVHSIDESIKCVKERAESENFLAVEKVDEEKVIGNVFMTKFGPENYKTWMIGYVFNSDYWGKGYASEAIQELLKVLFEEKNAHRVIARCNTQNSNSLKLLERNNFRREAEFKKIAYFSVDDLGNPNWHDAYEYSILEEEWIK